MADNPSAFPSGDFTQCEPGYGMTLRDWFAGQALISLANEHHGNEWGQSGVEHGPRCARKAYCIADAMLVEREKLT